MGSGQECCPGEFWHMGLKPRTKTYVPTYVENTYFVICFLREKTWVMRIPREGSFMS